MVTPAIRTSMFTSPKLAPESTSGAPALSNPAVRRLEVLSRLDEGVEIPAREVKARQELHRAVHGDVAGALRGPQCRDRLQARRPAERQKGVADRPADLERHAGPVPAHGAGEVHGALPEVVG